MPEREAQRLREAFAQEFHSYFCNAILTRNGEERVIAWSNVALYDRESLLNGILTVGKDITEQLDTLEEEMVLLGEKEMPIIKAKEKEQTKKVAKTTKKKKSKKK